MASYLHIVEWYDVDGQPCSQGREARVEVTHLEGDELDQVMDDLESDDFDDDEDEDDEDEEDEDEDCATLRDRPVHPVCGVCPLCGNSDY